MAQWEKYRRKLLTLAALAAVYWALLALFGSGALPISTGLHRGLLLILLALAWPLAAAVAIIVQRAIVDAFTPNPMRDSLTGVFNRRAFLAQAEALLGPEATTGAVGLVLYDVVGLEEMNHECGEESGDRLLCLAARQLERATGRKSPVFRIGGNQFAVLVNRKRGGHVAQVIRGTRLLSALFPACGHAHDVYLTCGYASSMEGEELESLLERARLRMGGLRDLPGDGEAGKATEAPPALALVGRDRAPARG